LEALGHHDLAVALDRLDRAAALTQLARCAAFDAPLQEVENMDAVEHGEDRA
jgi:hypothetical protein